MYTQRDIINPTRKPRRRLWSLAGFIFATTVAQAQSGVQWVEGFAQVKFHHNANRGAATRDFLGMATGFMTAGWWAPGQMKENYVSWQTAAVPAKQPTTFSFVAATAVLPLEFSRGPMARLSINGRYALTFTLGCKRDFTWKEGDYELKYSAKRTEFPYFGSHRQLDLNGDSGLYHFSVPTAAVEAGQPAALKVEIVPFAGWNGGWFMVKDRRDTLRRSLESQQGEIEALRQDMVMLNEQTHMLATQAYRELTKGDGFTHQVIYSNGFRHVHPADLVRLQNGELLLMTREASEHYSADGDVIMLRSKDGGLTWGEKQVIAGLAELDEREGCGVQLRDGTVVVGIFYNANYNPSGTYNFEKNNLPPLRLASGGPVRQRLGCYVIRSTDNGHTWSAPDFIDPAGMPVSAFEGPTDAPFEMPDGSLLMAMTGYRFQGDEKDHASVLLRSLNQGKTWSYVSVIASDPGGLLGGFVEPGIMRAKSGRLISALRNQGPDHAIYVTHSDDDGKTWAPLRKTAMYGHPVDLMQLTDGRILASYGIRVAIHDRPGGIRACFSSDDGLTWDLQNEVQLRNDFPNWDVGYPESIELPDGRVLTVYYYNLFGKYFIGGTFWKPAPPSPTPSK